MNKFLTIAGFIVGLIGLIVGLYSYLITVKTKEISYNVYSPSYKIYDNETINNASSLKVLLEDSIKIDRNIYMTTFSIWNTGDLPIDKNDIRSDIVIKFKGINKLINYKIIKEVDKGVSNIIFTSKNDSIFNLDWRFFDPGNGIKVQLLYTGDETVKCEIYGSIFEVKFKEFIPIQNQKSKYSMFTIILSMVMTVLIWLYSAYRIIRKGNFKIRFSPDFLFTVIYPILFLLMSAYLIYSFYFRIQEIPF